MKKRILQCKIVPLLIGILFTAILFWTTFLYKLDFWTINSIKTIDFFKKFWIYIPFAVWLLSILISYILIWIFAIIRLSNLITKLLVYLLIYWFRLVLWLDFMFIEKRYTDTAIILIDWYSVPLIVSSWVCLVLVILLSFFKKKEK